LKIVERKYKDSTFYLVGGKQDIIEKTVEKIREDYPNINILGYRNGYLKGDDEQRLIDDIVAKKPDVVFVAMGSPKQELLMENMLKHHSAVYQGLGGSFDVYTGRMKRAPEWWIKHNLEGPYRVMTDPKKWKRFVQDIWVLFKIKTGKI
jgi:UDP-N-acetyl-D-mannosaminouronate:lipid I N-acetyl-D-mannosaminouronosyltransferase